MIVFDRPPGRDAKREGNLRGFRWLVHVEWREPRFGKTSTVATFKQHEETVTLYARDENEIQRAIEGRWRGKIIMSRTWQRLETSCDGCGAVVAFSEAIQTNRNGKRHFFCPVHTVSSFPDEIRVEDVGKVIEV